MLLKRLASRISMPERSVTRNVWTACAIAVTALGIASVVTYLARPVPDRYAAFTFADVALANAAVNNPTDGGPSTLVILDSYDAMDVQFLDAGRLPTIVAPMTRIAESGSLHADRGAVASRHCRRRRVGHRARRHRWSATDPQGNPVVFEVVPQPEVPALP